MRSSFFWDFTQPRLMVSYRRFGTTYRSHLQGSNRHYSCAAWLTASLRCVKSQKSSDLVWLSLKVTLHWQVNKFRRLCCSVLNSGRHYISYWRVLCCSDVTRVEYSLKEGEFYDTFTVNRFDKFFLAFTSKFCKNYPFSLVKFAFYISACNNSRNPGSVFMKLGTGDF